jgi:hypothetical protein
MRHVAVIGIACAVLAAYASRANEDDDVKGQKLIHAVCSAGRLGIPLEKVIDYLTAENIPDILKNVWEGCRQETVKDISCYPFTINEEDNSRTTYMPGNAPSNARYQPLTADCKGRVGRWPAWRGVKEDPDETYRMGHFYANNPPGELPKAPSQ